MRATLDFTLDFCQQIQGWMDTAELAWIWEQAGRLPVRRAWVELGSWKGRSFAAAVLGLPSDSWAIAIDTWHGCDKEQIEECSRPGNPVRKTFINTRRKLERIRPDVHICDVISESACTGITEVWLNSRPPIGAVFVDAAHDRNSVIADLRAWDKVLEPDGLFCGHDRSNVIDHVREAGVCELINGPGQIWYGKRPVKDYTVEAVWLDNVEELHREF